nr:O-antigen ligase family protein [uncultured Draconibacterium sp.]
MKNYLIELIDSNLFFLSLIVFVLVLPMSVALVSVVAALVLLTALFEDTRSAKWERIKQRKVILLIPLIFLLYLVSTFVTLKYDKSFYDVQKTLFYLVFPLAFSMGKEINSRQKRFVLYTFTVSSVIAIIVAILRWKFIVSADESLTIRDITLVSHIRFSFQINLLIWFWALFLLINNKILSKTKQILILVLIAFYVGFLMFQQSLTGIVALVTSSVLFLFYLFNRIVSKKKIPIAILFITIILTPLIYLYSVVHKFYNIEKVDPVNIEKITTQGNSYTHDFSNKMVENGHYVYLYVCKKEMKEEWNKVAEIEYDSVGVNGYPIRATLIRYLTSKGLRKDAEGVKALSKNDIENIEKGMGNVIFQKKYSLYPRIYQTVWEYYVYSQTGYSNNQSFSQRIEFAKAAITIIKENTLLGVGTGRWKTAFAEAFKENGAKLEESNYASSHNQYLNYLVKFGVFGFVFIMFILISPIVKTKRYQDQLLMLFLVFMFFANFADSNLETHIGSSFFFFFYCFFLTGSQNYLALHKPDLKRIDKI